MANQKSVKTKNTTPQSKATEVKTPTVATDELKQPVVAKDIDPTQYVVVRNGFQGKLFYKSSRTGESFEWNAFGDEQEMELRELRNARNAHKKYFVNNWFMFDEDWIVDYLGIKQYYKNALSIDHFDDVFHKSPDEIRDIISKLSEGQRKSVAYRAKQLINEGEIDSNKAINALEESLNIELIER